MGRIQQHISKPKFYLWLAFVVIAPVIGLIAYAPLLGMSRTLDIMKWTNIIGYAIIIVVIITFSVPLLAIIDVFVAEKRKEKKPIKLPSKLFWFLALIGILIPSTITIGLPILSKDSGNKSPQLLLTSQTGAYGIPDMAVVYWTSEKADLELHIGTSELTMNTIISDEYNGPSNSHVFLLLDLQTATQYFYNISDSSKIYNFTTMPASNDELRFAFSSDIHVGAGTNSLSATSKILQIVGNDANNYNILFSGGDAVEYGFIDAQWRDYINLFSPITTHIPYRPIIGNHDGFFGGENLYMKYLYPDKVPSNTGSRLYYKIEINNIHIFMLDLEWGTETYTAEQKAWFEAEISTVPLDDWVIVINHAMYYTSGIYIAGMAWWDLEDMINEFNQTFIDYDVDLVFSGHNHHLEVLNVSGVCYNVVGGFGGHPDPIRDRVGTGSLWYLQGSYGFVEVDINGKQAVLNYRDPDDNILQTFNVNE